MQTLDCLDGTVVLANTCEGDAGILSLQSLGITETFLGSICGKEETPETLLDSIRNWAKRMLQNGVTTAQRKHIVARTQVYNAQIGQPSNTEALENAPPNSKCGILIDLQNPQSNTKLVISTVGFFGNATGDTTFRIYDLYDGSEVASFTLALVAGRAVSKHVQIELPAYRQRKRYFIAHTLPQYEVVDIRPGSCNGCNEAGFRHGGMNAYGAQIANDVQLRYGNLQKVAHTSGLSVMVTLACDHDQWLCENANTLALPYFYLIGAGIMDAAIAQVERMNNAQTPENVEKFSKRAEQYMIEYKASLENAVQGMPVPSDSCYQCRPTTRLVPGIP